MTGFEDLVAFVTSEIRPLKTSNLVAQAIQYFAEAEHIAFKTVVLLPRAILCFHSGLQVIADLDQQ